MGFWTLITNLVLFFDYDVIVRLHDALVTSFLLFFFISRTTCVGIVGITPNDADYMTSYLSSMHYAVVSPSEKNQFQENVVFALAATQPYHIILHYASNFDILVTNTNNPSSSIEKRFRTLQSACTCISACVCGRGAMELKLLQFFFFLVVIFCVLTIF